MQWDTRDSAAVFKYQQGYQSQARGCNSSGVVNCSRADFQYNSTTLCDIAFKQQLYKQEINIE